MEPLNNDLKKRLDGVEVGSSEEKTILAEARRRRAQQTDEFAALHVSAMEANADESGVLLPGAAQYAAEKALGQVTGEFPVVQPLDVEVLPMVESMTPEIAPAPQVAR